MSYNFKEIEAKWQTYWSNNQTFKAENPVGNKKPSAEPFYVLDMFPYPSGAGLHVGHPLGYIASDIMARYKRHKGFNVLHPAGYDSFGLPAEQYAIQTGQHPAVTTEANIKRYREQLDKIGFSFDWSREVRTSDPKYYRWTQWIFMQIFNSWYDKTQDKARDISELTAIFEKEGNSAVDAETDQEEIFTAEEWQSFSEEQQQEILLKYRLTYLAETEVNWCPGLGTVLANDEIVDGVSERGGFPVVRKKMKQWNMRITAYADRLLKDLESLDWSDSLKESQRNWIGKSKGAMVRFTVLPPAPSGGRGVDSSSEEGEIDYRLTGKSEIIGELLKRAKEMRKNPTKAEAALWKELRNSNLGYKFRQQHPIHKYIVDFVCFEKNLIIEVDGEIHQYQLDKDSERELLLQEKKGFHIIRFTNDEILNNLSEVIAKIKAQLKALPSGKVLPPAPSGGRGGDSSHKQELKSEEESTLPSGKEKDEVLPPGEDLGGDQSEETITTFTTRPDTIFGVSFMTLAPEHELVSQITTAAQKKAVKEYRAKTAKRSERERMADTKTISGVFTGAYAEHPFTKKPIPIWISDYVLAGYGTGAVMAVPAGDERDYKFAKHFEIPIPDIFDGIDISEEAYMGKENIKLINSDFLNGLTYEQAMKTVLKKLEEINQGKAQVNFRLRDAVFSRQRYWGEPFPVYYKNNVPHLISEESLPLRLPEVEKYLPTSDGQPPLGRAETWFWDEKKAKVVEVEDPKNLPEGIYRLELNTMPGWAGSSWYFFRYMETENRDQVFASEEAMNYWKDVDLYIGGSEHATGHLLYARFWTKFLYDLNLSPVEEPFKKLINQGMILGESAVIYRSEENSNIYYSANQIDEKNAQAIHVDVSLVNTSNELDINGLKSWMPEFKNAEFVTEKSGEFLVAREVEKMSKSKHNVVNPDDVCEEYGADSLRLYEMFLGPLEQEKPWNTAGLSGVHSFLKKFWRLYHVSNAKQTEEKFTVSEKKASPEAMKTLHQTIEKIIKDIEQFHLNTAISTLMICVNELTKQKCNAREVLEPLAVLIAPFAPHIAEELWEKLGHSESIAQVDYPVFEEKYVKETTKTYPISFNGKKRFTLDLSLDLSKDEIEKTVMEDDRTKKQLAGRTPKKVIIVPGRIVNIVG